MAIVSESVSDSQGMKQAPLFIDRLDPLFGLDAKSLEDLSEDQAGSFDSRAPLLELLLEESDLLVKSFDNTKPLEKQVALPLSRGEFVLDGQEGKYTVSGPTFSTNVPRGLVGAVSCMLADGFFAEGAFELNPFLNRWQWTMNYLREMFPGSFNRKCSDRYSRIGGVYFMGNEIDFRDMPYNGNINGVQINPWIRRAYLEDGSVEKLTPVQNGLVTCALRDEAVNINRFAEIYDITPLGHCVPEISALRKRGIALQPIATSGGIFSQYPVEHFREAYDTVNLFEGVAYQKRIGAFFLGQGAAVLTRQERQIFEQLLRSRGSEVPINAIMEADRSIGPDDVSHAVCRIRKKMEPNPSKPVYLVAVKGGNGKGKGSGSYKLAA